MSLELKVIMAQECDAERCNETALRLESLLKEKVHAALRDLEVETREIVWVSDDVDITRYKAALFDFGFAKSRSGSRLMRVVIEAV